MLAIGRLRAVVNSGLLACACSGLPLGAAAQVKALPDDYLHVVEPGDTLIGLQRRLMRPDASWRVVQRLNRIANPRRLKPGSEIRIPLALLGDVATTAEVLHVQGTVWLERAGQARQPLAAATLLQGGDHVVTGAQSSASLRYSDGSRSVVGPDSSLRLERLARVPATGQSSSTLRLEAGSVDTRVVPAKPAPRFELRTPVVNLGVRGTDFRARSSGPASWAEVLEGRVAVGPRTALDAGFGTRAVEAGVLPPRRLLPAPDLSKLPARVERLPLLLTLPERPAGTRFRVQVVDPAPPERLLLDGLFDSPRIAFDASPPDGRYELRVRSSDADGVEGVDARREFVLKARPEPPLLVQPRADEKLFEDTVALAWTGHPEAASYRVQVADNPAFDPVREQRDDISGTETTLKLPAGRWWWRVASVRAGNDAGPWGDAQAFEREDRPPPPPPPSAEPPRTSEAGIVLSWSAAAGEGVRYQVQVARDAAFADVALDQQLDRTEVLLPQPEPGRYFVRVRAIAADGRSAGFGTAQVVDVPRSWRWLWLLLPLVLLF